MKTADEIFKEIGYFPEIRNKYNCVYRSNLHQIAWINNSMKSVFKKTTRIGESCDFTTKEIIACAQLIKEMEENENENQNR